MATQEALLKLVTLLTFLISNHFISLQAITLDTNTSHINPTHCIKKERQSLLKFKDGLEDPSGFLSSWVEPDCCTWKGVGCRYPTGEVVKLDLSLLNLGGKLSHYLDELQHLRYLNLSYNSFSGMIPSHLGNLSNLHFLDLYSVGYDSWVSDLNWLSSLSSLKFLDLTYVNLSLATTQWIQIINTIPSLEEFYLVDTSLHTIPLFLSDFNFSTCLSVLDLSYNNFSTQAPQWLFNFSSSLVSLKLSNCNFKGSISIPISTHNKLEELVLSNNQFNGELPNSLGHLKSLRTLDLYSNSISGSPPTSIGELSKLENLDLSFNKMNGSVPKRLGSELNNLYLLHNEWEGVFSEDYFQGLSKLKEFSISSSNGGFVINLSSNWVPPFSLRFIRIEDGNLGPKFPIWLQNQTQLESVTLRNVSISDTIPGWLWKISPHIHYLDLSYNQLRGSIRRSSLIFPPDAYIDLSFNSLEGLLPLWLNISALYLANNSFSGTIPVNFSQIMSTLRVLDLSWNLLNGSIPSSLGKLNMLYLLRLSNNHLSGSVHDEWMNEVMITIDLSKNNLSGKFPASMCSLPNLAELKMSNNRLYGKLPFSVKNCKNLILLDLGENKFSGSVPKWIGESLLSLQELRMRGNLFNGRISKQFCHLQELHVLDLAQNNISGTIPTCLTNLTAMKSAKTGENMRSNMELVLKGSKYTYNPNVLLLVKIIDLSCNNLSGFVPEDITNLLGLGALNLSNNHLIGEIPRRIGEMQNLETLDLSSNHISGQIPPSMSSMTFLSHLNLSHNNLSGPIPSGNQFLTFDKSIYEGNPGLCGNPLLKKCEETPVVDEDGDHHQGHDEDENEDKNEKLGLFLSTALGFVVGFWSFCGGLVIKRSWRDAYYGFLKKIKDWIVVVVVVGVTRLQRMITSCRN